MFNINKKINKKGSILDLIMLAVILLFVSVVFLLGYKMTDSLNTQIQSMDDVDTYGKSAFTTLTGYYPTVLDDSFLVLAIGIAIVTIAQAALVRVHPIFIIFYIIGLVITIIMSAIFSNVYQTMAANGQLSSLATNMVFMSKVMEYLPVIVGVFGTLLAIVMYKTWRDE